MSVPAHGRFERFPLWPEASAAAIRGANWTAYYRRATRPFPTGPAQGRIAPFYGAALSGAR